MKRVSPELLAAREHLELLTPWERAALAVLAIMGTACNRSEWADRLRQYEVRHPVTDNSKRAGVAVSTTHLRELVERLLPQRLVVESPPGNHTYVCSPAIAHALLDHSEARPLLERMRRAFATPPDRYAYGARVLQHWLQSARLAMYCDAPQDVARAFASVKSNPFMDPGSDVYASLLDPASPAEALALLPPELRADYLKGVFECALKCLHMPSFGILAAAAHELPSAESRPLALMLAALSGKGAEAAAWVSEDNSALALEARAFLALQARDFDAARKLATEAWHASKTKRRASLLSGPLAPLLTVLLATGGAEQLAIARAQLGRVTQKGRIALGYAALSAHLKLDVQRPRSGSVGGLDDHLELVCLGLVYLFSAERLPIGLCQEMERRRVQLTQLGAAWLAGQLEAILARAQHKPPEGTAAYSEDQGVLLELHQPQSAWEQALSMLEALAPAETAPAVAQEPQSSERRLVFLVQLGTREVSLEALQHEPHDGRPEGLPRVLESTLVIEPRVQTRRGNTFTAGRAVALKTLQSSDPDTDYLTPEDKRVLAHIQSQKKYWGGSEHYLSPRAPLALVGHPRVFWMDRPEGPPVEVVRQPARLYAEQGPHGFYLRIEPFANAAGIGVMTDAAGRLIVSELSLAQSNVQQTITRMPAIPQDGEARLKQLLGRMATLFTVESQLGVDTVAQVDADSRLIAQLARAEPGLRVRLCVAPLGAAGPRFKPCSGLTAVAAEIAGKRVSCLRDLEAERTALGALLERVPSLQAAADGAVLHIDGLPECLGLLHALPSLAEQVLIEWTGDAPLTVVGEAQASQLRLQLTEAGKWLEASGALEVDEHLVLDLVRLLQQRTADGAFVALGEDRFLALDPELREQLGALQVATASTEQDSESALRLPPIALGFVSPWLSTLRGLGRLKVNKRLAQQLARIEHAYATDYEPPSTFQAELRPYQRAGYEFLARLAHIGAGACLADDMGLGKTLMTLALLVARATEGPALVITPTSVRANWFDEALRFAPSLRLRKLEELTEAELDALEPFDVLVGSYTLLTQRIERIERIGFATLVLDEAQAIKNAGTQRARAVRRLVAEARVALTGTPVENHLGDLHGIMSFLNPGLLGDAKHFEARFAKPIQREQSAQALQQLRLLIAPFVLRRRKNDVLRELPPRTEITLHVEPEAAERAFSEALRREALRRLQAQADGAGAQASAVSILAEITRLRRAACHPQLIDAQTQVGAAKLERLVELMHELKEGKHRALVFSQFVDFLKIVRTRLEAEGFSYQYLDGSTSEGARRSAVTAFQSGAGDVFLISLKAGGFGLNLTAADYVIHLDPWWNPAVEAQASDRAHRIGQERPVTIYRLVNALSIEERVLSLHDKKQALAEELLSDAAEATRLDPQALLALLSD